MKKINKKIWLAGLAFAAGLLWAGPALATDATLPFYAALSVKPNILFMLDTSGSMGWCVQCANNQNYNPPKCCGNAATNWYCECNTSGCNNNTQVTCTAADYNRRIDIFKKTMVGTYRPYSTYSGNTVTFQGDRGGDLAVWNQTFQSTTTPSALNKILLVHVTSGGTYELVSRTYYEDNFDFENHTPMNGEQFYFVFKDIRDTTGFFPASLSTEPLSGDTGGAVYTLERFLMDHDAIGAIGGSSVELGPGTGFPFTGGPMVSLVNDGVTGNNIKGKRYLYTPSSTTSAPRYKSFNNLLRTNYLDQQTYYVVRLKQDTNCYYTCSNTNVNCNAGTKTIRTCYRPARFDNPDSIIALPPFFTIMDANDYKNMVLSGNTLMLGATKPLTAYLDYYNFMKNYTWTGYNANVDTGTTVYHTIFGDGTVAPPLSAACIAPSNNLRACVNFDGRGNTRTINRLNNTGTLVDIRPTNATISGRITSTLTNVTYIGINIGSGGWPTSPALRPGDTTGKEFYSSASGTRLDTAVRAGLDYGHTVALYPAHPTLSDSEINDPWFGDFFGYSSSGQHIWTGLPYKRLANVEKGIMDNFPDTRFGLMVFDSSDGQTDFDDEGAQLLWNIAEGDTNNMYLQELISQRDLNGDGRVINCPVPLTTSCRITASPGNNEYARNSLFTTPSGSTPIAGALRDIVTYLYKHYFTDAEETAGYGGNVNAALDTVPSMNGFWDWNRYGLNNYNGHILINDPYYAYGCRKSNVIFLTDGGQTIGIPYTSSYTVDTVAERNLVETTQNRYVNFLVNPSSLPNPPVNRVGPWEPTKIYFLGLALATNATGADTYARHMLESMADASDLPEAGDMTDALFANSEAELNAALNWIMNKIMEGTFTRSLPAINTNLSAGIAGYFDVNPDDFLWRGHLAYVDFVSASVLAEGSTTVTNVVDGASVLNRRTVTREIFTSRYISPYWSKLDFTTGNAATLSTLLFSGYPTSPTNYTPEAGSTLTMTDVNNLINFIRSESSPTHRDSAHTPRNWKLGAIFHSTPMSMGPPPQDALPNVTRYQSYVAHYAGSPEMAYVGALDGMLHGFFFMDPDGTGGTRSVLEEGFGYIPNYLLSSLYPLRMGSQQIYVDGDPNVGVMDVRWSDTGTPNYQSDICDTSVTPNRCWQTILFSGLRDGGPAYFSLNVTDISMTEGAVSPKVKTRWEFTDPQGPNARSSFLGASWSLPFVDEALYQPSYESTLDTRLILVFGGGKSIELKSYESSWLYILDADVGTILRTFLVPDVTQTCNVNPGDLLLAGATTLDGSYHMLDCDSVANNNHNQVPGNVLIKDINMDEFPDWIYFGDLQGRMWKANIHDPDPAKWGICLFFDTGDRGYDDLTSISTDCDGDLSSYGSTQPSCADATPTKRRPIFYRPVMAQAPDGDGFILYFGTGHIEDAAESSDTVNINYIFAIKDTDNIDECTYGEIWGGSVDLNSNTPSAATGGWPIKLDPGEKIIAQPQIVSPDRFASEISFATYKPFEGTDVCKPGMSYKWQVDYNTGKGALCTLTSTCTSSGWARKKAAPGLAPGSLVLGDITFTPILPTSTGGTASATFERSRSDLLNGYYYWWVK